LNDLMETNRLQKEIVEPEVRSFHCVKANVLRRIIKSFLFKIHRESIFEVRGKPTESHEAKPQRGRGDERNSSMRFDPTSVQNCSYSQVAVKFSFGLVSQQSVSQVKSARNQLSHVSLSEKHSDELRLIFVQLQ